MTLSLPHASAADPLALRFELRKALREPALARFDGAETVDPALAGRAAYRLALALGECRLFGVDLRDEDGSVPPAPAVAAARQWGEYLKDWIADTRRLGERWDETVEETEAIDMVLDLLVARMESWAVFLAVGEASCMPRPFLSVGQPYTIASRASYRASP